MLVQFLFGRFLGLWIVEGEKIRFHSGLQAKNPWPKVVAGLGRLVVAGLDVVATRFGGRRRIVLFGL